MNTEMRWLPTAWENKELRTTGPAVRDLQDAQGWCQQNEDMTDGIDLEWEEISTSPVSWGASSINELDYEIMTIEVQV